eukprot:1702891-Prymnesium_polylepis.2
MILEHGPGHRNTGRGNGAFQNKLVYVKIHWCLVHLRKGTDLSSLERNGVCPATSASNRTRDLAAEPPPGCWANAARVKDHRHTAVSISTFCWNWPIAHRNARCGQSLAGLSVQVEASIAISI